MLILIDGIPLLKTWLERIHTGRFKDKKVWQESLRKRTQKWMKNMPGVKLTDNNRLILLDIIRGCYTSKTLQQWQEAALILGLGTYIQYSISEECKNDLQSEEMPDSYREITSELKEYVNRCIDLGGWWRERPKKVECALYAYAVMKMPGFDERHYKPAMDETWNFIRKNTGEDGTVMYRKEAARYRYVDTIGFICPFLIRYGRIYNVKEAIQLGIKQIEAFTACGMYEDVPIVFHAYKIYQHYKLGIQGWARGMAWFVLGLTDSFEELPPKHPARAVLAGYINVCVKEILKLQHEDGAWSWMMTRKETRKDSSATSVFSWFLLKASRIERVEERKQALSGAEKAIRYLMSVTRRNGKVDYSQGDTKDIGVYSQEFNILPFTEGMALRTISLFLGEFKGGAQENHEDYGMYTSL